MRRQRGVPTREAWRVKVRNEPLRTEVLQLWRGGENLSAIARATEVGRTRVRTILREELGADAVAKRRRD
jgi:hypothetical protein